MVKQSETEHGCLLSLTKKLVAELKELFLKDGAGLELIEKGFYHKAKVAMPHFGGSIDKNTEMLEKVKNVILELERAI